MARTDNLRGIPLYYSGYHPPARWTMAGVQQILIDRLNAAVEEMIKRGLKFTRIYSLGAFNPKSTPWHSQGVAFDWSGVRLSDGLDVMLTDWKQYTLLLSGIDACLRMHFPVVLDPLYDPAHKDHFHVQPALNSDGSFNWEPAQGGNSKIRFAQHTLNLALDCGLEIDGVLGSETAGAIRSFEEKEGLPKTGKLGKKTYWRILEVIADLAGGGEEKIKEKGWILKVEGKEIPGVIYYGGQTYFPVREGLETLGYKISVEGKTITASKV